MISWLFSRMLKCLNPSCGHLRTQHSRNGCTWPGCGCTAKYMDKEMFE